MKILRVRRGFTTNSSGSNEFVPPAPAPSPDGVTRPAPVSDAIIPSPVSAIPMSSKPGTQPAAKLAQPGATRTNQTTSTAETRQSGTTGKPAVPAPHSNALVLLLVALGVMLLFVVERIVRLMRRRHAAGKDEGDDRE